MTGAISLVRTTSTSCSVANAAAPSAEEGPSQNRRRDRRTYQFDRSSISAAIRRPAAAESNASSDAVTSRTQALQLRQQPPVQQRPLSGGRRRSAGLRRPRVASGSGRVRVQHQERDRVPVGQQHLAHDLVEHRRPDPALPPRRAGRREEPAHRVRAVPVHQPHRLHHVAEVLGHLAPLLVDDVPQAHHVLVRRMAEHQGADRHQRVEPAAGLVDRLADELRRVRLLELTQVPQRRAVLRERHRSRVEPGVDHLGHPRRRTDRTTGTGTSRRPRTAGAGPAPTGPARQARRARPSEPTQVRCPFGHSHSGSGVPQYRVRDSAQSTLLRSHSP